MVGDAGDWTRASHMRSVMKRSNQLRGSHELADGSDVHHAKRNIKLIERRTFGISQCSLKYVALISLCSGLRSNN